MQRTRLQARFDFSIFVGEHAHATRRTGLDGNDKSRAALCLTWNDSRNGLESWLRRDLSNHRHAQNNSHTGMRYDLLLRADTCGSSTAGIYKSGKWLSSHGRNAKRDNDLEACSSVRSDCTIPCGSPRWATYLSACASISLSRYSFLRSYTSSSSLSCQTPNIMIKILLRESRKVAEFLSRDFRHAH